MYNIGVEIESDHNNNNNRDIHHVSLARRTTFGAIVSIKPFPKAGLSSN